MASYVNELIHSAGGNLARPTKFTTNLTIPSKIAGDVSQSDMNILCKTFTIPAVKTEDVDYKFRGHTIPIVGRVVYDHTVSITFILDEAHVLRTVFKNWIESLDTSILGNISNASKNLADSNRQDRSSILKISALNWNEDTTVIDYIFTEVHPISVSGPEFQTDGVSSVLECTVEFAFVSMVSKPTDNRDLGNLFNDSVDFAKDLGAEAVDNLQGITKNNSSGGFTITYNKGGDFFTIYGGN